MHAKHLMWSRAFALRAAVASLLISPLMGNAQSLPQEKLNQEPPKVSSPAQQIVIGAPKAAAASASKKLTYRDPSLPLSIEEMSEIQRKKLVQDALEKAGFTTDKSVVDAEKKAVADAAAAVAASKPKKVPKESVVAVTAVYSVRGTPVAEVSVNGGRTRTVKAGEPIIDRVSLAALSPSGATLRVEPSKSDLRSCKRVTKKKCPEAASVTVAVGGSHRLVE